MVIDVQREMYVRKSSTLVVLMGLGLSLQEPI